MRSFCVFAIALMGVPVFAQQFGRNPAAALTHIHLNAADPDASIAFWTEVIGTATYTRDSMKGVSTLGTLLLFSRSAPTGPSAGSAIDHIAFRVPDIQTIVARLAKTPYKSFTPPGGADTLMIDGIDGIRIELMEDNAMYAPLEFSHIHFHSNAPAGMQAWYAKFFGARSGPDDPPNTARLAGGMVMFSPSDTAPAPTAGRAIDHLSFEVRDLPGFCATLTAGGVKLDTPLDSGAPPKGAAVYLTDPWGVRIELTSPRAQ